MESDSRRVGTVRNERVALTDHERSVIDSLDAVSLAGPMALEGADALADMRREFNRETREAFTKLFPDSPERAGAQLDKYRSVFDKLKGAVWPPVAAHTVSDRFLAAPPAASVHDLFGDVPVAVLPGQPAHAGELWWAETSWSVFAPSGTINVDIDADPNRIWGHIGYDADPTLTGNVGLVMTFMLTPDRYPRTPAQKFEIRPDLRTGGWVSGWTGLYEWPWHADDKWSKLWRFNQVTLTLSTGEPLAGDALSQNLFFLDNVAPVGQGNASQFQGWVPVLVFRADLADLRRRGISMIFRVELRYDFQLEGESDIWFRHNPGSASESVPAFDNALTVRCWPGVVTPLLV
jgi:hypothetical protein